jgi:hypothetical protein
MTKLRGLVADFWRRVEERDPYQADYGKDAAVIAAIYRDDDGGEVDLTGNERIASLLARREQLKAIEAAAAAAKKEREPIDAELIAALGNATRGLVAGGAFEAKTTRRAGYTVKPGSYRAVKVIGAPVSDVPPASAPAAARAPAKPAKAKASPDTYQPDF